jgi:Asp-tRNA(Asn)/Glu-tRNA(Gln) amidotransferase A subunit family amidase
VRDAGFSWDADFDWRTLRVGYLKDVFESSHPEEPAKPPASETEIEKNKRLAADRDHAAARARREYDRRYDQAALDKLRAMGVDLKPVALPNLPYGDMSPLLTAEAAAAFDDLTMSGRDKLLTEQSADDWPNLFRVSRFYPAVEYIQANRARTLAIQQMAALFQQVDVIVTPSGGDQLVATNLTGHPAVIVPNGIRGNDAPVPPKVDDGEDDSIGGPNTPVSITILGGLYQDAKLCAFARAYQQATGFQKLHPKLG